MFSPATDLSLCLRDGSRRGFMHHVVYKGDPHSRILFSSSCLINMCHATPTAQLVNTLAASSFTVMILWHIYKLDKGRTLVYTRKDAFRWFVVWMLVLAASLFTVGNVLMTIVKYEVGYGRYPWPSPSGYTFVPVPYQFWSSRQQQLYRVANQISAIAWACLLWINAEEIVFWLYLFSTITRRQSRSWFASWQFKVWVAVGLSTTGCMIGITQLETDNLLKMEHNTYTAGSVLSMLLFCWSLYILVVFPRFIRESRRQGATPDVLSRLLYFKELNGMRSVFRFVFCNSLLIMSFDAYAEHAMLNKSAFWTDFFFVVGHVSVFLAAAISMFILMPRNMIEEAGLRTAQPVYIGQPCPPAYRSTNSDQGSPSSPSSINSTAKIYQRWTQHPYSANPGPTRTSFVAADGPSATVPWNTLQGRLNLEEGLRHVHELQVRPPSSVESISNTDMPFQAHPDSAQLHLGNVDILVPPPRVVQSYRSPVQFDAVQRPVELAIVVHSDTVVY